MHVCIAGPMGSGKSTTAKIIQDTLLFDDVILLNQTTGIKTLMDELNYQKLPSRKVYQDVMEYFRELCGPDCHCRRTVQQVEKAAGKICVVDDVRQHNEMAVFKEHGFVSIGITAPDNLRANRLFNRDGYDQTQFFTHPKEYEAMQVVKSCDFEVTNNGSIAQLKAHVRRILNLIPKRDLSTS